MNKYKSSCRIATVVAVFLLGSFLISTGNVLGQVNPKTTVISPNGGEVWARNSVQTVTWRTTGVVTNVSIQLVKGAYIYRSIVKSTPNTGSYSWIIPTDIPEGTDYKIRVKGTGVAYLAVDRSDGFFSIKGTIAGPPPSITPVPSSTPTISGNNAQFISQNVPSTMNAGQNYTAYVTFKNIGTTTWTKYNTSSNSFSYNLGSQNPQDNTAWSISRVGLPGSSIAPGTQETFVFSVKAPSVSGTYNFQWRMVQEMKEWFGDFSPSIAVNVISATPAPMPSPTSTPTSLAGYPVCGQTVKNVPSDYSTIQAAINASSPGDTIRIAAGIYSEGLTINKNGLCLDGAGIDQTVIMNSSGSGVFIAVGYPIKAYTIIKNLTIRGSGFSGCCLSGGGIYIFNSTEVLLQSCRLTQNTAYSGGGIYITNGHNITVDHCLIDNNHASDMAGGVYVTPQSQTVFTNVTIANNIADHLIGGFGYGWDSTSSLVVNNSIFWGNIGALSYTIPSPGYGTKTGTDSTNFALYWTTTSQPSVSSSDIGGWSGGTGNISADPQFISSTDFHLQSSSPAINTGDPSMTDPDGSRIDMGVYPFVGIVPTPTPILTDDAVYVSQSSYTSIAAGQVYPVSITMKNTGTSTWTKGTLFRLGSQNPQDNLTWGLGRVELAASESFPPGTQKTFNFNITAPSTPGLYNFQWQMVHDGISWFGNPSTNVPVNVYSTSPSPTPTPTPIPGNNAQFQFQTVPATMNAGQTHQAYISFKNTGTSTWTKGTLFRLGSQNPQDNLTWGLGRVELSSSESVAPGASKSFNFNVTAPTSAGSYNFQWQMVQDGVAWFGDKSTNVAVNVAAASPTPTPITITYPGTGVVWGNQNVSIYYTAPGISRFGFKIYQGSQAVYEYPTYFSLTVPLSYPIGYTANLTVSNGSYRIQFPCANLCFFPESGNDYRVRVFDWDHPEVYDDSNYFSYDVTSPLVSAVSISSIATSSAVINWITDEPANGYVNYGSTTTDWKVTPTNTALTTYHSFILSNLTSSTRYNFRVYSVDAVGNGPVGLPTEYSFTTLGGN